MSINFGPFVVTKQVFFQSQLSFGLVNLKPLLPGHVLIIPKRVTPRLKDLTTDEVTDLFLSVKKVSTLIEKHYNGAAMNIAVQDGADAGQTVPHVHVHLIPRSASDPIVKDEIYEKLQSREGDYTVAVKDQEDYKRRGSFPSVHEDSRKPRSEEEMNKEAEELRAMMKQIE